MKDFGNKLMKEIIEKAKKEAKKRIEDKLRPLQSEIRKEGAIVKIVDGKKDDELCTVSISGASPELTEKINKALKR